MSLSPITSSDCVSFIVILHKTVWISCIHLFSSLSHLTSECFNAIAEWGEFTTSLRGSIRGSICMQNPHRLSVWEAQTMGRHWTKDGERDAALLLWQPPECTGWIVVVPVQSGRNSHGGGGPHPCYVRREKNKHEMGSYKWNRTIAPLAKHRFKMLVS